LVDVVDAARGVHPADPIVEALIHEELSPRDGAVCVEPFVARDLDLGPKEERRVRVDQEKRMLVHADRRPDGDAVRACGLGWNAARELRDGLRLLSLAASERLA